MPASHETVDQRLHYVKQDVGYGPVKIDADGVAEQGFNIGDRKLAQRNKPVPIDVTIEAPDGTVYKATTSFTPRFAK